MLDDKKIAPEPEKENPKKPEPDADKRKGLIVDITDRVPPGSAGMLKRRPCRPSAYRPGDSRWDQQNGN